MITTTRTPARCRTPGCSGSHRPYGWGDKAIIGHANAITFAWGRAWETGVRQTVRLHRDPIIGPVWFVQAIR